MLCDCVIQVTPTSHSFLTWPVPDQEIFWAIDGQCIMVPKHLTQDCIQQSTQFTHWHKAVSIGTTEKINLENKVYF